MNSQSAAWIKLHSISSLSLSHTAHPRTGDPPPRAAPAPGKGDAAPTNISGRCIWGVLKAQERGRKGGGCWSPGRRWGGEDTPVALRARSACACPPLCPRRGEQTAAPKSISSRSRLIGAIYIEPARFNHSQINLDPVRSVMMHIPGCVCEKSKPNPFPFLPCLGSLIHCPRYSVASQRCPRFPKRMGLPRNKCKRRQKVQQLRELRSSKAAR